MNLPDRLGDNPLDSFARGLLNITQVHDVVSDRRGTLDCDAENGDWWVTPKIKRIAWRPRAVAAVDSENICLHGITVQNSYSWTIHPIFVKHLDLLNFNINNPYNAPNTDGIDPESCRYIRIIGVNIMYGRRDCIAMKASKVFLGMKLRKRADRHTVIWRHWTKAMANIVIGSEIRRQCEGYGDHQCLMDHTDRGLRARQDRRGRGLTPPSSTGWCSTTWRCAVSRHPSSSTCSTSVTQTVTAPIPSAAMPCPWRVHPKAGQPDHGGHRRHRRSVRGMLLRRAGAAY